jgi:S-adenosylmethionine decarboxylase
MLTQPFTPSPDPSVTLPGRGEEWIIDAHGCQPAALCSIAELEAVFAQITTDVGLHPVGAPLWHQFPAPGGITGLWLLSESHLCCHTFPELGHAAFNLYCCRPRPPWDWEAQLRARLGATAVTVRSLRRAGMP